MLLKVDLEDGPYLADVGFGGHLVSAPLKLAPGLEQSTDEAVLRLEPAGGGEALVLQTRLPAGWTSLYRFTLEPAEQSDYEVSNWYTSTHPNSSDHQPGGRAADAKGALEPLQQPADAAVIRTAALR